MSRVNETKLRDMYLVQIPDDLMSVSELPVAEHICYIKLPSCGKPPKGEVIEEIKQVNTGLKVKKVVVPNSEYYRVSSKAIEDPDLSMLIKAYADLGLNPHIKEMKIMDGGNEKIVWRSGHGTLTAISRNGDYLTEELALELAKEVGGHVCQAEAIERKYQFTTLRCIKPPN